MKQLSEKQAIAFYDSKIYEDWTPYQVVRFQLFQKKLALPLDLFHKSLENVLDRPVWTHELGMNRQGIINEFLGTGAAPTFDEIVGMIPQEKLILLNLAD